jgi:transposase-like protein
LRSYGVAHRELIPESIHDTSQYANNRAELSHQSTRVREGGHAEVQIDVSSAAILSGSCCRVKFIHSW